MMVWSGGLGRGHPPFPKFKQEAGAGAFFKISRIEPLRRTICGPTLLNHPLQPCSGKSGYGMGPEPVAGGRHAIKQAGFVVDPRCRFPLGSP